MKKKRAMGRRLAQEVPDSKLVAEKGGIYTITQNYQTESGGSGSYNSGGEKTDQASDADVVTQTDH